MDNGILTWTSYWDANAPGKGFRWESKRKGTTPFSGFIDDCSFINKKGVSTHTFYNPDSDCSTSSATSAFSVFLVMTVIVAATAFMITILAVLAFFILATTSAFRAVRIAFTLAAGTVFATTFDLHFFLFLFVLLCKYSHAAGWKNEDTGQYDFLHKQLYVLIWLKNTCFYILGFSGSKNCVYKDRDIIQW